ncbi:MAG: bifunctional aldolase/short-chain dehydrogenase [Actinomycetota bacterium]|nr:bifunctional aldolase/short-chain dehydrogenase [Actinomycetota bacterium]
MKNLWDETDCKDSDTLSCCAYGSRLLGGDRSLVLHGGGNTSVKAEWKDVTGSSLDALYVKGSGWDLATIEVPGFTPLPLSRMQELLGLDKLSDEDMMAELSTARLRPDAPQPSVETLLHAFLPYRSVQHSHADVILSLTNVEEGEETVREVYGDSVVVVPYVMPGFDLAKAVQEAWDDQAHSETVGMVLLHHGLFTFAETTRDAYGRHTDLITKAEKFLDGLPEKHKEKKDLNKKAEIALVELANLRQKVSQAAGAPMILSRHTCEEIDNFVNRSDVESLATRGPLTPDHIIRTKRTPLIGRDVDKYAQEYRDYFDRNNERSKNDLTMLDPAPRVILDKEFGLLTIGATAKDADIASDIYQQTIPVLETLEDQRSGYVALGEEDLFDLEYWDLEQAKLRLAGPRKEFAGQIALVTGAASGIGHACAAELLARGASVIGFDINPEVETIFSGPEWLGQVVDVSDEDAQVEAIRQGVERFGGVDILVVGAGIFPSSELISELNLDAWQKSMDVNVTSVSRLFHHLAPLFALAPAGGKVVVVASRNALAPGKGAAAYSTAKSALTQLSRVAAFEWAEHGVRVNVVHPDNVFDTGLWTEEVLNQRAANYEMTVDEYKARNLLKMEVKARHVASVVVELCSDRFGATTGAQIPIDGGNERTI